jgi:hypothetical protein
VEDGLATAAVSTISAAAPNPRPCDTAMTADPANATARPAQRRRVGRSPRLSSSWYAVIPASPHNPIRGRSRARGRRTPANGAASASATEATPKRATDNPAGPRPATATEIAGNALAHSTTVPAAAHAAARPPALVVITPPGCQPRQFGTS